MIILIFKNSWGLVADILCLEGWPCFVDIGAVKQMMGPKGVVGLPKMKVITLPPIIMEVENGPFGD